MAIYGVAVEYDLNVNSDTSGLWVSGGEVVTKNEITSDLVHGNIMYSFAENLRREKGILVRSKNSELPSADVFVPVNSIIGAALVKVEYDANGEYNYNVVEQEK